LDWILIGVETNYLTSCMQNIQVWLNWNILTVFSTALPIKCLSWEIHVSSSKQDYNVGSLYLLMRMERT